MNSGEALLYWKTQIEAEDRGNPLKVPVDVALREAVRAAAFLKRRWDPQEATTNAARTPGMSAVSELSPSFADELLSLVRAVYEAQLLLLIEEESIAPIDPAPLLEMRFIVAELKAALTYLLGSGLSGEDAQRIQKLNALPEHQRDDEASLRLLVTVYLDVAERQRSLLAALQDSFEMSLLERARVLLTTQRQRIEQGVEVRTGGARALYYGLLSLLMQKVQTVRTAARYVFRRHPTIVQEVTSAHQRARVRKAKNNAKKVK